MSSARGVGGRADRADDSSFHETEALLRRAQEGDRASFGELLAGIRPRLLGRIRLMMGPGARQAAESGDFLQGVFAELVRGWERYRIRSDRQLLALATEIARNQIRAEVRRRREEAFSAFSNSGVVPPSDPGPGDAAERAIGREDAVRLAEALERLPDGAREVIELRHLEQLSFAEVGERMGRSENAAQQLHARALTRLGRLLREPGDGV